MADINDREGLHLFNADTEELNFLTTIRRSGFQNFGPVYFPFGNKVIVSFLGSVYVTDGTSSGTLMLRDFGAIRVGGSAAILLNTVTEGLDAGGSTFYFEVDNDASEDSTRSGLWLTDGTPSGTRRAEGDSENEVTASTEEGSSSTSESRIRGFFKRPTDANGTVIMLLSDNSDIERTFVKVSQNGLQREVIGFSSVGGTSRFIAGVITNNFISINSDTFFCNGNSQLVRLSNSGLFDVFAEECDFFKAADDNLIYR